MDARQKYQLWYDSFKTILQAGDTDVDPAMFYQNATPTFYVDGFQIVPGSADLEVGLSRFEGVPDLPSGYNWPDYQGKALDFLAQINLAELEQDFHARLPDHGWLYFFAADMWDEAMWDYNLLPHKVLYFDGPVERLEPAAPPPDLIAPSRLNARTALICFKPGFSMDPNFLDLLGWSMSEASLEEEYGHLFLPLSGLFQQEITRIGGYPYGFQGGGFEKEALLFLNGFPTLIRHGYFHGAPLLRTEQEKQAYYQRRFEEIEAAGDMEQMEREARKYQEIASDLAAHTAPIEMLFGLESVLGRSWGDAGFLEFFIRQEDLAARCFEYTFCDIIST
jgi:hypothetical protein